MMDPTMKHARVLSAAVLALTLPLLQACHKPVPAAPAQGPRAVRVAKVELRPLNAALETSGLLVSREEAAVTSELPGYRVTQAPWST